MNEGRTGRSFFATVLMVAVLATGCGSSTSPSGAVTATDGGEIAPSDRPAGPSADPAVAAILAAMPTSPVRQAGAVELEERLAKEVIAASGLVADLGPERWAWADAALRAAMADAAADAGVAYGPPKIAAAYGLGVGPKVAEGATVLAIGLALGVVNAAEGSNVLSGDGLTTDSTSERTENGERTVATITGHMAAPTGQGRIVADVEFGVQVAVFDAASGQQLRTSRFRTTGRIELDECPDADGKVRGHVRLTLDAAGGDAAAAVTVEADVVGTVDESATLTTIDAEGSTGDTMTEGATTQTTTTTGGARFTVGPDGSLTPDESSVHGGAESDGSLDDEQVNQRYRRIFESIDLAAWLMGDKAQKRWRGGACVEIHATEQSRTVKPSALVQFEATPFHKIEQRNLDKPILASFSGERSAEPMDDPHRPPVLYSFTAAPQKDKSGTITMTSTSNRGIGTLAVTFTTALDDWTLDVVWPTGSQRGKKCGGVGGEWIVDGTYTIGTQKGIQRWVITIDPQTLRGTFTYSDKAKRSTPLGTVEATGTARGTAALIEEDGGGVQFQLVETFHSVRAKLRGGTGKDQNAPLQVSTMDHWEPGADCPTP